MIIKKHPGLVFLFFLVAALTGCATTPPPKFLYSPTLPAGIETLEMARNDLSMLLNSKTEFRVSFGPDYLARQGIDKDAPGYSPQVLAQSIRHCVGFTYNEEQGLTSVDLTGIELTDEGFRLTPQILIPYTDLYGFPISVGLENIIGSRNTVFLVFGQKDQIRAQRVADYLYFMQQHGQTGNVRK
ncbi:MAG: hypothetical protein ACOZBW_08015 [Thermodesulfobacteriota bacterium]